MTETNEAFTEAALSLRPAPRFSPRAFHNVDGDCIELLFSNDNYYAERLSNDLTVLRSEDSDRPIGLLLKGVRGFLKRMMQRHPGLRIEIEENKCIRSDYFISLVMWDPDDDDSQAIFSVMHEIRELAGQGNTPVHLDLGSTVG